MSFETPLTGTMSKALEATDAHRAVKLTMETVAELPDDLRSNGVEFEALLVYESGEVDSVDAVYLLSLTFGLTGLQVVWTVILSNGSPFLVSLGLSKSLTALVWIAAPLCGSIVQPLVGSMSDRTLSRFGRRRPFILAGTLGIVLWMLFLAWAEELVHLFVNPRSGDAGVQSSKTLLISFATLCIYGLNIAIQPVQAGLRSLIVENCPLHQQSQASTYASVMTGLGNIIGYLFGFGILPAISTSSVNRFQTLCVFASICLLATVITSCITIHEKSAMKTPQSQMETRGLWTMLKDLKQIYKGMPNKIRKVYHVQFLAWMGWFPFLFYSTTYVGEFYARQMEATQLPQVAARTTSSGGSAFSHGDRILVGPEAIRYGTFASFLFAVVAWVYNMLLPHILRLLNSTHSRTKSLQTTSLGIVQAWTCSHGFFALLMFATFFANSQAAATVIIAFAGLSWALTLFVPFAIISTELAAKQALLQDLTTASDNVSLSPGMNSHNQTGAVMGLHNVAISAPQILAALSCSAIFAITKALGVQDGTVWALRAGGVAAVGAAWLCSRFG